MKLDVYLNTLRQEGYLAYEYNPFHNYLTNVDLYLVNNKYIVPKYKAINITNGLILNQKGNEVDGYVWIDKNKLIISEDNIVTWDGKGSTLYATAGSLIDFDTDLLNFDINHPVDIEVQPSYDGSVNLILNDNKNIPRLINSRFSPREKNKYEIVDRIGENDSNIYSSETFDKDTSLYFLYLKNPTIKYLGFTKGNLSVGQYCFYFTYCDSDNNESDFIAESGVIPAFIGNDGDPNSMDGGIKNQSSNKGIKLRLENLDASYNYIKVYYVRYFADYLQNRVYECKKIFKKYPILLNTVMMSLYITGYEDAEDIDPNILNISKFNPKSILTQALCKNMLFFGNIVKNSDNYRELLDCALRIIPSIITKDLNIVDSNYRGEKGYYDSRNMYENVGYFPGEYYRFGVVFIYNNGTLSNVYNTIGGDLEGENSILYNKQELYIKSNSNKYILLRNYIKVTELYTIDPSNNISGNYLNSKGVCRILIKNNEINKIYGIRFEIPDNVKKHLKEELGIRGLFFVRQKCIPTILAQCYIMPFDSVLKAPVIHYFDDENKEIYITESFLSQNENNVQNEGNIDNGGFIVNDYNKRLYKYGQRESGLDSISKYAYAGICPDFLLNLPYYNQIFNGGRFKIRPSGYNTKTKKGNNSRLYVSTNSNDSEQPDIFYNVRICTVTENVSTVAIENQEYKLNIGEAEEAYRIGYADFDGSRENENNDADEFYKNLNLVRGTYSPYLAIYSDSSSFLIKPGQIYDILPATDINVNLEYKNRMNSREPFYAISERLNFDLTQSYLICWRGDCFINQFTYRVNRNFNDPSLPNNDLIIDPDTWRNNYSNPDLGNGEAPTAKWNKISRSDINAVRLGSWITFKVRSSVNYALRSEDHSFVSEEALMGAPRSFYPRSKLLDKGANKMPDSYLYNDAYRASLGYKCYFTIEETNYIKDTFSNRILYSAISILDSFKNNYRDSLSTYFRDYSQEYGGITKLVSFEGYLLVVFEHAIGIAVINERVLSGQGDGEPVFINTNNVLPEELTIISDTYGTQWTESVIKSEAGFVYGVDTIAKKIWRIKGLLLEILSDFKVNKFLVDNITLGERELFPIVGLKNVKTHYNNNKKDILFTFYDDIYLDEEKVWNLCYNELLDLFVTFYSWVPSYSENIDTKFFTFDRSTSKNLSLLYQSNYNIAENKGVVIDSPMMINNKARVYYRNPDEYAYTIKNEDGTTSIKKDYNIETEESNKLLDDKLVKNVSFRVEKDHWNNWKLLKNISLSNRILSGNLLEFKETPYKVILLYITPIISTSNNDVANTYSVLEFKTELIAVTSSEYIYNNLETSEDKRKPGLTTDFYLHGKAGAFNVTEDLYPCYWYSLLHPFEFEFVVNDKIGLLKIFENLIIISNNAEPESFHFEVEGDNYEFSLDKRTMYFRLEATKELYQNLGSDIIFNRYFTDVTATKLTLEKYYRSKSIDYLKQYSSLDRVYPVYQENLVQQVKSSIFPLYYERVDKFDDIYHSYKEMSGEGTYDFKNLSGSEILWNRDLNQFNVVTHIKNNPINIHGRLRGNSMYKEGKWNIQIPSIIFNLKNELSWKEITISDTTKGKFPPIIINTQQVPKDITTGLISKEKVPNIFRNDSDMLKYISVGDWSTRKETRIRDKWIKIRVRYSGKNLAIIHSLVTLYNVSYS